MKGCATSPARRISPQENRGGAASLRVTLEALILSLVAALLGRPRGTCAWLDAPVHVPASHPLPIPAPAAPFRARTPHDGTHLVCESPILYVLGPGPNPGLRPHPRAMPLTRARIARAPPRAIAGP